MKIGLVSDTHENTLMIIRAVELMRDQNLSLIIHCGDIISPPVLERFAGLPMRFVFGNNDGERFGLKKKCEELGFGEIDDVLELELAGRKILAYHGTSSTRLDSYVKSEKYDYVFHGHTHVQRNEAIGKTQVVNPGALFCAEIYSVATVEVESGEVEFIEISE